jgi:hypothetical protein
LGFGLDRVGEDEGAPIPFGPRDDPVGAWLGLAPISFCAPVPMGFFEGRPLPLGFALGLGLDPSAGDVMQDTTWYQLSLVALPFPRRRVDIVAPRYILSKVDERTTSNRERLLLERR